MESIYALVLVHKKNHQTKHVARFEFIGLKYGIKIIFYNHFLFKTKISHLEIIRSKCDTKFYNKLFYLVLNYFKKKLQIK